MGVVMTTPDTLEAGPELDKLVAERVMGWTIGPEHYVHGYMMHGGSVERSWVGSEHGDGGRETFLVGGFKPSTLIADAWLVVEHIRAKNKECFHLIEDRYGGVYSGGNWLAYFGLAVDILASGAWEGDTECSEFWQSDFPGVGVAPTAPLAICRAALKAVGAKP